MRYFEQDHPSFHYSSESQLELFTGDLFQLQLYKTPVDNSYRFTFSQHPGSEKDVFS